MTSTVSLLDRSSAALNSLDALREALADMQHPQEFGLDGCPACKANDLLSEAGQLIQEAEARIRALKMESPR